MSQPESVTLLFKRSDDFLLNLLLIIKIAMVCDWLDDCMRHVNMSLFGDVTSCHRVDSETRRSAGRSVVRLTSRSKQSVETVVWKDASDGWSTQNEIYSILIGRSVHELNRSPVIMFKSGRDRGLSRSVGRWWWRWSGSGRWVGVCGGWVGAGVAGATDFQLVSPKLILWRY